MRSHSANFMHLYNPKHFNSHSKQCCIYIVFNFVLIKLHTFDIFLGDYFAVVEFDCSYENMLNALRVRVWVMLMMAVRLCIYISFPTVARSRRRRGHTQMGCNRRRRRRHREVQNQYCALVETHNSRPSRASQYYCVFAFNRRTTGTNPQIARRPHQRVKQKQI